MKAFWKHKVHYILIACCVGFAFVTAHPFGALLAVVGYVIGIINIPGSKWFTRITAAEAQEKDDAEKEEARKRFQERQRDQYESLSGSCQGEYDEVVEICARIECNVRNVSGADTLLSQLDHMMFTFLKLLVTKVSIQRFLDSESSDVSRLAKQAEDEVHAVEEKIKTLDQGSTQLRIKQRLLTSKQDRLKAIKQRHLRVESSRGNLEIVVAEQEKIIAQLELMHADIIAGKGVDGLSDRLSSSLNFLEQTNQWLSEIDEYEYTTEEMPGVRVGYAMNKSGQSQSHKRERQAER